MSGWSMIAMVACLLLPTPAVAAQPAPAPAVPAFVPCPLAELDPAPDKPAQPSPPPHRPGERQVGGEALATAGLAVPPGAPDLPPDLSATTWLVADLDTGEVLGGCGPHEYGIPASTQKLLLVSTLLPELDPDRVVEVELSDMDFEPGSSAVGLLVGGEYTVETLWLGLLLNSGNDAANVLARIGGGDGGIGATLEAMNQQARRLGAFQTHAATPSGLDGPGQFTSAYDLALIARQLFDQPDFLRYAATERTDIPAQPDLDVDGYQIQNQNDLLTSYPGALGGKTGYTDLARHSFVGAAEQDGRRLVVTLLGAEQLPVLTWQQAAALLDWGFSLPAAASVGRLVDPEDVQDLAISSTPAPTGTPGTSSPPAEAAGLPGIGSPVTVAAVALAVAVLASLYLLVSAGRRAGRRRRRRRQPAGAKRGRR